MDDLKEFLYYFSARILALSCIATLLLFCLVAGSAYGFMRFKCRQTAIIVGTDYRFSIFAGCYLRDQNNQWLQKRIFLKNNNGKQF